MGLEFIESLENGKFFEALDEQKPNPYSEDVILSGWTHFWCLRNDMEASEPDKPEFRG